MAFNKEKLFKSRLPEDEVEVPDVGTVRVRGLSRAEVLDLAKAQEDGADAVERVMLANAIVAIDGEPVTFTQEEIGRWQAASTAGEMTPIGELITKVSGMHPDSGKDAYTAIHHDADVRFRVSDSGDAGEDDL